MTLERRVEVLEQAVHDILNGIQQLTNVVREHNQQNAELFQGLVGIVTNQQEQLTAQQGQLATQQDQLATQQDQLATQQDQLATQQDQLAAQQGQLAAQQEQLATQQDQFAAQQEQLAAQQNEVAEYRRDAHRMQRLWVHLARKHGWLDDEDWPPPEES